MRLLAIVLAAPFFFAAAAKTEPGVPAEAPPELPFFRGLGDLPGGPVSSDARDISTHGDVVVGTGAPYFGGYGFRAVRWVSGAIEYLGMLEGGTLASAAYAVSADGTTIVGDSHSAQGFQAYRWKDGEMVGLGDLPGGPFSSNAHDVSSDGSVVVGVGDTAAGYRAFRWTPSTGMVRLTSGSSGMSPFKSANAVSADGSVVVGSGTFAGLNQAYRFDVEEGVVQWLGTLPDNFTSYATDVSADGSVVVGVSANRPIQAFRWTEETGMVGLGNISGGGPAFISSAYGVSEDGSMVVGRGSAYGIYNQAAVWTERDGMRSVRAFLAGFGVSVGEWVLYEANAVSDNGIRVAIVGTGENPDGDDEAWIAVVPSRPCDDGRDNDRDGFLDSDDPGCQRSGGATEDPPDFDTDGDGVFDADDNCPDDLNSDQADLDGDQIGDVCDDDLDGDGIENVTDNCPLLANSEQNDFDDDGIGDSCDPDADGDGVDNISDGCDFTSPGAVIEPATGCSVDQLVPCDGPRGGSRVWKNHGEFVSARVSVAKSFLEQGLISAKEKAAIISESARSDCGKGSASTAVMGTLSASGNSLQQTVPALGLFERGLAALLVVLTYAGWLRGK